MCLIKAVSTGQQGITLLMMKDVCGYIRYHLNLESVEMWQKALCYLRPSRSLLTDSKWEASFITIWIWNKFWNRRNYGVIWGQLVAVNGRLRKVWPIPGVSLAEVYFLIICKVTLISTFKLNQIMQLRCNYPDLFKTGISFLTTLTEVFQK